MQIDISKSRFWGNATWSVAGWLGSTLLNFISIPIIITFLGKNDYGLIVLLFSFIDFMGLLDFGLNDATVKYLAESIGKKHRDYIERYLQNSLTINLIVTTVGFLLILFICYHILIPTFHLDVAQGNIVEEATLWLGLFWVGIQMQKIYLGALTALQRYELINISNVTMILLRLVLGVGALVNGKGVIYYIATQSLVVVFVSLFWSLVINKFFADIHFIPRFHVDSFIKTIHLGFWQFLNNLAGNLSQQLQRWLLAIFLPIYTVGFYNLSSQLACIPYMIAFQIGQVIFPTVSELEGQQQHEKAILLSIHTSWLVSSFIISIYVSLIILLPDILTLWLGPNSDPQIVQLSRILSIGNLMGVLFAIPSYYLLGSGRAHWLAIMSIGQGIITVSANLWLIPKFGIIGASWGAVLGTLSHFITLNIAWARIFKPYFSWPSYAATIFGPYITGLLISFLFISLRLPIPRINSWLELLLNGTLYFLFSAIILIIVGTLLPNGQDRRYIISNWLSECLIKRKINV